MTDNGFSGACLLCGGKSAKVIESFPVASLRDAYEHGFKVEVSRFFDSPEISFVGCDDCGLRGFDPMPAGDALFYEQLQRLSWYYQDDKPEYSFAKLHVGDAARVLEVGCGKGAFRAYLPESVSYAGLEFNGAAVEKAHKAGLSVTRESVQDHASRYPGAYDVVAHFQVLEHVSDPLPFLRACKQALKPGGKLIVAVPAEDSFLSICETGWLNLPPHHVTRWPDSTLEFAMSRLLELQVIEMWHEPIASYHADWHRSTMTNFALKSMLGRRTQCVGDNDLTAKVIRRLAAQRFIQDRVAGRAKNAFRYHHRGHTVCCVATKPN